MDLIEDQRFTYTYIYMSRMYIYIYRLQHDYILVNSKLSRLEANLIKINTIK